MNWPVPLPSGLGLEGAGRVLALGSAVRNLAVGDRVAYVLGPLGGYASERAIPAARLLKLPEDISMETAAAALFKGITAHYLLHSSYAVQPGSVVLIYGVAGGLGQFMVPWAKHLGATVIGVVSKAQSVAIARERGCDAVIVWGEGDLAAEVVKITGGRKADAVYDGVGKVSFAASLDSLRPRGVMVSMGASTGAPEPVPVGLLNAKGSLFLIRPSIVAHATDIEEYAERASAVFSALRSGIIRAGVWKRYALSDAAAAHADLDAGRSDGALVLLPK